MPEETLTRRPRAPRKTTPKDGRSADCTPAETQMWSDILSEQICRLDEKFPDAKDRHIRAEEFRKLCLSKQVPPTGIVIYGAIFPGKINLENCNLEFGIELISCKIIEGININRSWIRYFSFFNCTVEKEINARNLTVLGSIIMANGFIAKDKVDFSGSNIGGQFICSGGKFENESGNGNHENLCLYAQGIEVSDNVFLRDGFVAKGQVSFAGAKIGGQFICSGGRFEHGSKEDSDGARCLYAQGIEVSKDVFLRDGFVAKGQVSFSGAKIGGQFNCIDGKFEHGTKEDSDGGGCLDAEGIYISGHVFLRDGFVAKGQVGFASAKIGGQFNCINGKFEHGAKKDSNGKGCLSVYDIDISGAVFLSDGFAARGQVDFGGAKIGGQFICSGGRFEYGSKEDSDGVYCFHAESIEVSKNVILDTGFVAKGQVSFAAAKIGGQFICSGGRFEHGSKEDSDGARCLYAQGIEVSKDVFLSDGFVAKGQVSFSGAKIGGQFNCIDGKFEHGTKDSIKSDFCLAAEGMSVSGHVFLSNGFVAKGRVNFAAAKVDGQLICSGGRFEYGIKNGSDSVYCFHAQSIEVSKNVILDNGFVAHGQVCFDSAKISGSLNCSDAKFFGYGCSLDLWKAIIDKDVFLSTFSDGFYAKGLIRMTETRVGGNLICGGVDRTGRFNSASGVFLGGIMLDEADISGTMYFAPEKCGSEIHVRCGDINLIGGVELIRGNIDLSGTMIGKIYDCYALVDHIPTNWFLAWKRDFSNNWEDRKIALFPIRKIQEHTIGDQRQKQYKLYGLRYKEINPRMCRDWRELVEWIRNADGNEYHPQPYERLAAVLQAQGHESESNEILIARRRHRFINFHRDNWFENIFVQIRISVEIIFYDIPIRFGYKPWHAGAFAIFFILLGWMQFYNAEQRNLFVPSDGDVLTKSIDNRSAVIAEELHRKFLKTQTVDWETEKRDAAASHRLIERDNKGRHRFIPEGYPEFNAFTYTLDTFLPIIDLQQNSYWVPDRSKPGGRHCWRVYWWLDILGWFLTTLLVASLSGLVRERNPETIEP